MTFGNLNYERWHCEAGCAAVIILIFGKQQEICEVELHWWDIFPVRRLSGGPVWHEQNASQPPPGTGKQLCHSIAAQSDQTGKRPPHRARLQSPVEVKAHRGSLSKSSLLFPIWQGSCGYGEGREGTSFSKALTRNAARLMNHTTILLPVWSTLNSKSFNQDKSDSFIRPRSLYLT